MDTNLYQRSYCLLLAIFGNKEAAEQWWVTPNKYFKDMLPVEVFEINPEKVYNYLLKVDQI